MLAVKCALTSAKRLASVQVIMSEVKVGWLPKVQMFRTQELSFLWIKGLRYRNL